MRNRVAKVSVTSCYENTGAACSRDSSESDLRGVDDGYFHPKERVGGSSPPTGDSPCSSEVEQLTFRRRLFPQFPRIQRGVGHGYFGIETVSAPFPLIHHSEEPCKSILPSVVRP